jgi:hypothetical protein
MDKLFDIGARVVFGVLIFAVLAAAILTRPPKGLSDFDQALCVPKTSSVLIA